MTDIKLILAVVVPFVFIANVAHAGSVHFIGPKAVYSNQPIANISKDLIHNLPLITKQEAIVEKGVGDLSLEDLGNLAPAGEASSGDGYSPTVVSIISRSTTSYMDNSYRNNLPSSAANHNQDTAPSGGAAIVSDAIGSINNGVLDPYNMMVRSTDLGLNEDGPAGGNSFGSNM